MRRIRVVHLSRTRQPCLELESSDPSLLVRRMQLRKISSCRAWQLIGKKLKRSHPKYQQARKWDATAFSWRDYNRLQSGNFQQTPLATYRDWIRLVEPKLSSSLLAAKHNSEAKANCTFLYQQPGHGDLFTPAPEGSWVIPMAVHQIVDTQAEKALNSIIACNPSCQLISTDYDRISITGTRYEPYFKPALNVDLAYSDPLYSIGSIVRYDLWNEALKRYSSYSRNHSIYGIILEVISLVSPQRSIHLPHVLFHLQDDASERRSRRILPRATTESLLTLRTFLEAHQPGMKVMTRLVKEGEWGQCVTWPIPQSSILASVLLPTRDAFHFLSACTTSLFEIPAGVDFELIIIDNGSIEMEAKALLQQLAERHHVKVIQDSRPFNYSELINAAASHARGDVLCLLNNDTEVITPNWLGDLVAHAMRPEIGCVGPMLLYADNTVQHGGVVLGIGGIAGHGHKYFPSDASGYQSRLQLCHNVTAVTGACLVVKTETWKAFGGLDEKHLAVNYNDVDFCLKASCAGLRNLYVPVVKLYHYESKSRGAPSGYAYQQWQQERLIMLERWGQLIANDPAYSPHLSRTSEDYSLSLSVDDVAWQPRSLPVDCM